MPCISSGFAWMCNRFPRKPDFHVVLKQNISEAAPPYFSSDNISFLLSAASVARSVLGWIKPFFKCSGKVSFAYITHTSLACRY